MSRRGLFVTLEGVEGVGKSTHSSYVATLLREAGHVVLETREPGGTALGEAVRQVLLDPALPAMHPLSELLLVFAARAEHLARVIEPALARGEWVVCDRFTDATFAYQGGGRGLDRQVIESLQSLVQGSLRPDFTLLFTAPIPVALARAKSRGTTDRFESERVEFFERVQQAYLDLAGQFPARFKMIDAAATLDDVRHELDQWARGAAR